MSERRPASIRLRRRQAGSTGGDAIKEYATKRAFDMAVSALGLLAATPIIVVCAVAVRCDSEGPALFRQRRIGRDEREFTCLKLRTMRIDTASLPTHEVSPTAITPTGRLLRNLKLDELPQLWNVLIGDMSFVGPRPCLPTQRALIEARRAHGLRHLRPGITGPAQVAGIDMSEPARLAAVDASYLKEMSLRTDIALILRTLTGAGRGDHVRVEPR
ncbi:MAG: sugar transferase [Hyphomicrobium sp.]|uniref:sugar transferase n=1 Tax=Hyphomicrobium sp. TaxID=82 RepID=UPI003D0EBD43